MSDTKKNYKDEKTGGARSATTQKEDLSIKEFLLVSSSFMRIKDASVL